jgi:hypothetical protein
MEIARIAKEQNLEIELVIIDSANLPWWDKHKLLNKKRDLVLIVGKKLLSIGWQGIIRNIQRKTGQLKGKFGVRKDDLLAEVIVESESDTEYHLERTSTNLSKLSNQYNWNPIHTKVHLIRSSQHVNMESRNQHVDIWEILSKDELTTYQINGNHGTIFEGKSAVEMAHTIERIIGHETE